MKKLLFIGYWFLQCTWGILMTFVGAVVTVFCVSFLHGKVHKNGFSVITEVGGNWGGVELGAFALCGSYSQKDGPCYSPDWFEHTRRHEFGHTIQNCIFGPFQLFVVGIPSAARYWYDALEENHKSERDNDWYDSIWFEGTATAWGTKAINYIEKDKRTVE